MKTAIPPFLARLGLHEQVDERTIRRTYARLLKQTDQETDPEGFQSLREAYEIALAWRHHLDSSAGSGDAGERSTGPALGPAEGKDGSPSPGNESVTASGLSDRSPPHFAARAHERAKVAENAEHLARVWIEQLRNQLARAWLKDRKAVLAWLEATMDDPRMADMDARFLFEGGVVVTLAEGWTRGRELLFGAAMAHFGWKDDRGRLAGFGQAGSIVATAISEMEFFDSQPDAARATQRDLIRKLRGGSRPSTSVLLKQMPIMEQLAERFPHWLHIITDTKSIGRWRDWSANIPAWRRWFVGKPRLTHGRKHGRLPRIRFGWGLALFLGLGTLLRIFATTPQAPNPPLSNEYVAPSLPSPSSSATKIAAPAPVSTTPLHSASSGAGPAYAVPPRVLYPANAKRAGREGRAVVKAVVRPDGTVHDAIIHQSAGSVDLDDAAITAVRNAVFVPAKDLAGKAVSATFLLPFDFKLSNATGAKRASDGGYAAVIGNAVRPHIVFGGDVNGNPAAEITLRLAQDGRIEGYRLTMSSGVNAWDQAVVRAIQSVRRLPADENGKVPAEMVIVLRPKP